MAKADLATVSTDDLLASLLDSQTKRRTEQKALDLMEQQEKTLQAELIKRGVASGTHGNVVVDVSKTDEPFVADWAKTLEYIRTTGELDLLEKRLLKSGAKARWADGIQIPGVDKIEKTTLKVEAL